MKNLLLTACCCLAALSAAAQRNYAEAIRQGDDSLGRGAYEAAIGKYFAAEAFDPSKKEEVKAKVNAAFERIDGLRRESEAAKTAALKAQNETRAALRQAEEEKEKAEYALAKAKKLVEALFFYDGKFALAYGRGESSVLDNNYYFINKEGNKVNKLQAWDKAEPFDDQGFAKVQNSFRVFLLDTLGNTYLLADDLKDLNGTVEALDLSGHGLKKIPHEVYKNSQIKVLLLSNNDIDILSDSIRYLKNLAHLDLYDNMLKVLPPAIGELDSLKTLNLGGDSMTNLDPKTRTPPTRYGNKLKHLPDEIGQLEKLQALYLDGNEFSTLPVQIGALKKLQVLHINNNRLRTLPDSLWALKDLRELDLRNNRLEILPPRVGELQKLQKLNLSFNRLKSVPTQLGSLFSLKNLYLAGNDSLNLASLCSALQDFPKPVFISSGTSLLDTTLLMIKISAPARLPANISGIKNLVGLNLYGFQLDTFPDQLLARRGLRWLILSNNQLSAIPHLIGRLTALETLTIPSNRLRKMPTQISGLKNLQFLNLSNNLLVELPPQIGELKQLRALHLVGNQLSKLPASIESLKKLDTLLLRGNPLPPAEVQALRKKMPWCTIDF